MSIFWSNHDKFEGLQNQCMFDFDIVADSGCPGSVLVQTTEVTLDNCVGRVFFTFKFKVMF